MPELDKIVEQINLSLKEVFHVKDKPCKFLGISDTVPYDGEEQSVPAVMQRGQDGQIAIGDDRYAMLLYHRITSISYSEDSGYGRQVGRTETADMVCVCWCDPVRLRQDRHRIITMLGINLNQVISLDIDGLGRPVVETNNINTNQQQVFEQEYRGFKNEIKPEHLLFAATYQITTTYEVSCYAACPEC